MREWKYQKFSDSETQNRESNDAFETVGIFIRAKINRLCNEGRYAEAEELERALIVINSTDYTI